jgi:hypothetical protein
MESAQAFQSELTCNPYNFSIAPDSEDTFFIDLSDSWEVNLSSLYQSFTGHEDCYLIRELTSAAIKLASDHTWQHDGRDLLWNLFEEGVYEAKEALTAYQSGKRFKDMELDHVCWIVADSQTEDEIADKLQTLCDLPEDSPWQVANHIYQLPQHEATEYLLDQIQAHREIHPQWGGEVIDLIHQFLGNL